VSQHGDAFPAVAREFERDDLREKKRIHAAQRGRPFSRRDLLLPASSYAKIVGEVGNYSNLTEKSPSKRGGGGEHSTTPPRNRT